MANLDDVRNIAAGLSSCWKSLEGPTSEDLISELEHRLKAPLPKAYRNFISAFGRGGIFGSNVFGISTRRDPQDPWFECAEMNETARSEWGYPNQLIIIGGVGDGDYYALDIRDQNVEPPVVIWPSGASGWDDVEVVARDFFTFVVDWFQSSAEAIPESPNPG